MSKNLKVSLIEYKRGAFITIQNKEDAQHFYIIKDGKAKITKQFKIDPKEKDLILGEGHFIGIISCMSRRPREETAQAIENVTLIRIEKNDFKALIENNPAIAMKIIRSFSSKLRYLDTQMMTTKGKESSDDSINNRENSFEKLYEIANFYYQNQEYIKAYYVYYKYINSGQGVHLEEAKKILYSLSKYSKQALNERTFNPDEEKENEEEKETGLTTKFYKSNTIIFCEYEIGKELFLIQEGQVKITKIIDNYEKIIAILRPGDIFGEMALLENQVRSATSIAYGNVSAIIVNQKNFEIMVKTQSQLAMKMIYILSDRLWTGFRQLENKAINDILAKILDYLILTLEKEKIVIKKTSHTFNFGIKELLKMIDVTLEEGKSYFSTIIKNKILSLSKDGKKITCPNLEALKKEWYFEKNKALRKLEQEKSRLQQQQKQANIQ